MLDIECVVTLNLSMFFWQYDFCFYYMDVVILAYLLLAAVLAVASWSSLFEGVMDVGKYPKTKLRYKNQIA